VKDLERMTKQRFHSTLTNQCYVYKKYDHDIEYLQYVRQRFINSEHCYKEDNIPSEFKKLFFQNNFFDYTANTGYIVITIHLDNSELLPLKSIENILEKDIYINII
jgi:hypothetical protein